MAATVPVLDPNASGSDTDDSDFAASDSYGSDYDSSASETSVSKRKRKHTTNGPDEALASGDEGIVESGKRKRRKRKKKGKGGAKAGEAALTIGDQEDEGDEEEEGVGVRLRRRREGKGERESKKTLGSSQAATIDVDALWERLKSAPTKPAAPPPPTTDIDSGKQSDPSINHDGVGSSTNHDTGASPDMITIKRTYTFAGNTTTEEKLVPRESAEARLYLSSQASKPTPHSTADNTNLAKPIRRPLRRPSRFDDPDPRGSLTQTTNMIKSHLVPTAVNNAGMSAVQRKIDQGQKLNTVEKSKLDWAGYVDKEKLKDELDMAEKAKGSYLDRMEFLGRSDQAREEGLREGRRK